MGVAGRGTAEVGVADPPTTAHDARAKFTLRWTRWINHAVYAGFVIVAFEPIVDPLPNIADHVVEAKCVGYFLTDRMCRQIRIVESSTQSDQVRRRSLCRHLLGIGDNRGIGILFENFGPRKWLCFASKSNCLKWAHSVEKRHETPISEVEASDRAVKSKI